MGFHTGVGMALRREVLDLEVFDGDGVTLISALEEEGVLVIAASVANDLDATEAMHCCSIVQCLCPLSMGRSVLL